MIFVCLVESKSEISLPILLAQLDYGQADNVHRLCRADISRQISRIGAAFGIGAIDNLISASAYAVRFEQITVIVVGHVYVCVPVLVELGTPDRLNMAR